MWRFFSDSAPSCNCTTPSETRLETNGKGNILCALADSPPRANKITVNQFFWRVLEIDFLQSLCLCVLCSVFCRSCEPRGLVVWVVGQAVSMFAVLSSLSTPPKSVSEVRNKQPSCWIVTHTRSTKPQKEFVRTKWRVLLHCWSRNDHVYSLHCFVWAEASLWSYHWYYNKANTNKNRRLDSCCPFFINSRCS